MFEIEPAKLAEIKTRFLPDVPGPLVELHVIQTGNGRSWVNRWPNPDVVLTETAGNYSLVGEPDAIEPVALHGLVQGFVAAPTRFLPLLQAAFPNLIQWERVVLTQAEPPVAISIPGDFTVRRLTTAAAALVGENIRWVAKTWGGVPGMIARGRAWGAFTANGRLCSLACTFFLGDRYEEIGIATEPAFQRRGLSSACAAAWCADVARQGRRGSWTTSPDNVASLRVAHKLGFREQRRDWLYVVQTAVPAAP